MADEDDETDGPDEDGQIMFSEVEFPFTEIKWWSQFPAGAIKFSVGLVVAIILVLAFWLTMKVICWILLKLLRRSKLSRDCEDMIVISLKMFMWCQLAPIVVGQTGLPMDSVVTVVGAIVLGVGLACRPTVENFVAGGMLELFDSFRRGHVVCLAGNVFGEITQIHLSYVALEQLDGETVYIPNKNVYAHPVRNFSRKGRMRIDADMPLAVTTSSSDVKKARKVMLQALKEVDRVLVDPPPTVLVKDINAYQIVLAARVWVLPEHYLNTHPILNEVLRETLLLSRLKLANRLMTQLPHHVDSDSEDNDGKGDGADSDKEEEEMMATSATAI